MHGQKEITQCRKPAMAFGNDAQRWQSPGADRQEDGQAVTRRLATQKAPRRDLLILNGAGLSLACNFRKLGSLDETIVERSPL